MTFQTLAKLPDTRLAKLRAARNQAELNLLCDRSERKLLASLCNMTTAQIRREQ